MPTSSFVLMCVPASSANCEPFRRQSSRLSRDTRLERVEHARSHRLHDVHLLHSRVTLCPRAHQPRTHLGKCHQNSHSRSFAPVDTCSPPSAPSRSAPSSSRPTPARGIILHRSRVSLASARPRVRARASRRENPPRRPDARALETSPLVHRSLALARACVVRARDGCGRFLAVSRDRYRACACVASRACEESRRVARSVSARSRVDSFPIYDPHSTVFLSYWGTEKSM